MCPKCWKKLTLCSDCSHEATRHPAIVYVTTQKWELDFLTKFGSTGTLLSTGFDCGTMLATSS